MVKLRLKRFGRRHRPFYRLNAMDLRAPRDGMPIEELGTYDPLEKDNAKAIQFNTDRVRYWLGVGAQPSETVRALLRKSGVELPTHRETVGGKKESVQKPQAEGAAGQPAEPQPAGEAQPAE